MTAELDALIHPTPRLQICAMLDAGESVEMSVLRDALGLSASALSKQVAALVDAGYIRQGRSRIDSRRIWLALTKEGKQAYRNHVRALQAIVSNSTAPA